jgi:hypothetical protein
MEYDNNHFIIASRAYSLQRFARLGLKIDDLRAGRRVLGLQRKRVNFGEK